MTVDDIRRRHRTRPFEPFVIHVGDSRKLTVSHPEMLTVGADGRNLVVHAADGTTELVDTAAVTGLTAAPSAKHRSQA
jgi:hypothetical protein